MRGGSGSKSDDDDVVVRESCAGLRSGPPLLPRSRAIAAAATFVAAGGETIQGWEGAPGGPPRVGQPDPEKLRASTRRGEERRGEASKSKGKGKGKDNL